MIAGGAESHLAKLFLEGKNNVASLSRAPFLRAGKKNKTGPEFSRQVCKVVFRQRKKRRTEPRRKRVGLCVCVLPNMAFLRAGKSFAPSHARCVHQTRKRHSSDANTHHLHSTPEECMRKWKRDLWSGGREEGGEEEEGEIEYFTREGGARGRGRRRRFLFPLP